MMFDKYCVDKILAGEKTVTRRMPRGKQPARPGKIHKLKIDRTKNTYGLILITDCYLDTIGDIDDKEAKKEGFNTRKEYIDYFMDVNNIDILSDYDLVWKVEFELISD